MKYKIEVNREECVACGSCYATDSVHFMGDSEGKSLVVGGTKDGKSTGTFDDDLIIEAKTAADACCVSAISVTEI